MGLRSVRGTQGGCGFTRTEHRAIGREHLRTQAQPHRRAGGNDISGDPHQRGIPRHLGRAHEHAPRRDVVGRSGDPSHPAVDASPGVPARCRLGRGVGAHREQVHGTKLDQPADVIPETHVTVRPLAEQRAVEPHPAVRHHSVELDPRPTARHRSGKVETLAIPGNARRQPPSGTTGRGAPVKGPLDAPVVRHTHPPPCRIVKTRLLGT